MNLTLKPELTEFIQQEILIGKYANPDEAIEQSSHFVNEAALHLLKSKNHTDRAKLTLRERLATELRKKIDSAAAQLDNGEGLDPESVLTGLRAKLRTDNPWLAIAGSLVDDRFFDDYITDIDINRQEFDSLEEDNFEEGLTSMLIDTGIDAANIHTSIAKRSPNSTNHYYLRDFGWALGWE